MAEALSIRKSIEELIVDVEVRTFCKITQVPVNVEEIVRKLGGKIQATSPQSVIKEKYRRGIINTGERSFTFELYLPKVQYEMDPLIHEYGLLPLSLDDWRKTAHGRYEIAHLLGHLLLHMGYQNPLKWESQEKFRDSIAHHVDIDFSRKEIDANQFAQALLMPQEKFREVACRAYNKEGDSYPLFLITEKFGVPELAAKRYGQRIGLFKEEE